MGKSELQRQGSRNEDPGREERPGVREVSAEGRKEELVGVKGGQTAPRGRSHSEDAGLEDARGALPAAPTRASRAPPPPPPRTRVLGGHTKGMARRAGCGAAEGLRARDEVAGPRRPPRPRLCLPRSAPPPLPPRSPAARGALTLLVTRVSSGLICSPAPSASMARRPARGGRYRAAPRGPPAARRPPPPPRPGRARENERASVSEARAWGEPCAADAGQRVRAAAAARALAGERGRGVERGARTERAGGLGGGGGVTRVGSGGGAAGRDARRPGPAPTRPLPASLVTPPASLAPPACSARPPALPGGHRTPGGREAGRAFVPANRRLVEVRVHHPQATSSRGSAPLCKILTETERLTRFSGGRFS